MIKERRKEVKKEKKHESVKKETTQQKKEGDSAAKSAQSVKRNALMNKNRGLPALPAAKAGEGTSKSALRRQKKKNANASQTVVGKKTAAANKHNAQKNKKKLTIVAPKANTKSRNDGRKVTSPMAKGNQQQLQNSQKKNQKAPQQQQQTKKNTQVSQQPQKNNKKVAQQQQAKPNKSNKNGNVKTLTVVTKDQARKVVRSENKAAKIRITIKQTQAAKKQSNSSNNNTNKKTRIMNVVLPGKVANNYSRSSRAQQVVKRVQSRKQSSSKNGAFVVRKPFVSRKN